MAKIGVDEVLKAVRDQDVKLINLQFTDLYGYLKSITIPVAQLGDSLNQGTWFDGSSIQGFTRIFESDMFLRPDPTTFALLPWDEGMKTARLICDVHMPDGSPFEGDPRYVLKRALRRAADLGFVYNTGPELEFFLLQKNADGSVTPLPHDRAGYFDQNLDQAFKIRGHMVEALQQMGLHVEASHHEVAPGQHEIDFQYADALTTADRAVTLKMTLKAVAAQYDLHATFMPKPISGVNGSGMHVHQSLFDRETGTSAMYDAADDWKLSATAKHFIAGQLQHMRALCGVIAPTVNSYKRLVPGYEAPVYVCWGQVNRSALIRIPRYSPGREQSTRCELRCPDPSNNPYLAFAALLYAGLDGVANKLEAPAPVEENVYDFDDAKLRELNITTLPQTLGEAITAMEQSPLLAQALGDHVYEQFLDAARSQWDGFRQSVSNWELERYLTL